MTIDRLLPGRTFRVLSILAALLLLASRPAVAQCSMGQGGTHDHGNTRGKATVATPVSTVELQHSIDQLLADGCGRTLLADSLLNDTDFMHGFVARLMADPKWSALATRMQAESPNSEGAADAAIREQPQVSYTCPMHPEVQAAVSGACPVCGMRLVRNGTDDRK